MHETFSTFLEWLSPDPEEAARQYTEIHAGLVSIFSARGCEAPHELADRTFDRVIGKIREVAPGYEGRPAAYIHGVAKKIVLEHMRSRRRFTDVSRLDGLFAPPAGDRGLEHRHQVLERCLQELSPEDRELILTYYRDQGQPRIDNRRGLAEQSQVSAAALRKRTQRIRERLKWSLQVALRDD
jgi:DNA-directed RNA polymerase specialized sigma24 family protein